MKVRFTGGPLDGREEDVPDDRLEEGRPIYWPDRDALDERDPDTPGLEGAAEYLYEGDGSANYVGGQVS